MPTRPGSDRNDIVTETPDPALYEAWSYTNPNGSSLGALVLHGFTGTPGSVRPLADAVAAVGYDVEMPRLPGHGTTAEDMLATGWSDWYGEVEAAYERLAARVERVVVAGQSMGGTLALALAFAGHDIAHLVLVNPATMPRSADEMEMLADFIEQGVPLAPAGPPDIADPDVFEASYDVTPLVPLKTFLDHGIAPITDRFDELRTPMHLYTSRTDHVVPPANSVHLADHYGGPVEHIWLERSYHVAMLDYDRDVICDGVLAVLAQLDGATR